ncbi:MAG TPA: hypothetical protein VNQ80_20265 [Parapedobacter sp.]|nr:hypothetical protein [Parapedobacter sp.]
MSSGFKLVPPPESHTVTKVLLWVRVRRGPQRGQLLMDIAKLKHAWQYEYRIGTLLSIVGQLGVHDMLRTTLLAAIGAVMSFGVTWLLHRLRRRGR